MKLPRAIFFISITLMLVLSSLLVNQHHFISADDDLEEVEEEIEETKGEIDEIKEKIESIKSDIDNLSGSLTQILSTIQVIENEIVNLNNQINRLTNDINAKSVNLTTQTVIRDRTLRGFYKKGPANSMVSLIQSNALLANTDKAQYLKKYFDDSLEVIYEINSDIIINKQNRNRLEDLRVEIESERARLVTIKAETEQKLAEQEQQLSSSSENLSSLNEKLQGLLAKQRAIIAAKEGNFYASLGEGAQIDDPNASPSYSPGFSPAFGAFSYGAYTHYKGMSQYGARGRAEEGQSYKDIIEFYYNTGVKEKDGFPDKVSVEGYGDIDFQYYLYGLAEMPTSWHKEALKAQAVAGRSYAYRYVKAGKSICTSQSCQVFSQSKADKVRDGQYPEWKDAVDDTKNKILDSEDTVAYYSSTTGGYIDDVGWDADGSWPNDAYEVKGGSPWFLKGWYTEGYRIDSAKCGRDHPWLTGEEFADVLNAYVIIKNGGDTSGISPLTTSCWGGDPDSMDELREKAEDKDKGFKSASSVSDVQFSNNGRTTSFKVETDQGSFTVNDAQLFKQAFNLRAPGYIAIRSRLFDVRSK